MADSIPERRATWPVGLGAVSCGEVVIAQWGAQALLYAPLELEIERADQISPHTLADGLPIGRDFRRASQALDQITFGVVDHCAGLVRGVDRPLHARLVRLAHQL